MIKPIAITSSVLSDAGPKKYSRPPITIRPKAVAGHPRMRLVSRIEPSLLDKAGIEGWLEYETSINYVLSKYDDPVICAYDLSNFSANVVIDMLRVHPVVIVGGVLQENPFFVPPEQFLLELQERKSAGNGSIQAH